MSNSLARGLERQSDGVTLEMMDRSRVRTQGSVHLQSVMMSDQELGPLRAQVLASPPGGADLVLGLDTILRHGLTVAVKGGEVEVCLGSPSRDDKQQGQLVTAAMTEVRPWKLEAEDYQTWFQDGHWTVEWRWKGKPPHGRTHRPNYKVPEGAQEEFNKEVQAWVDAGYLAPWDEQKDGTIKNVVPLMCVQQRKGAATKIRPVLDFRWLNEHILSRPGAAMPLCQDRLREWRQRGCHCAVVDLKKAYLQVRVAPELWAYQGVWWNGQMHVLTRLGFGLNVAPKIMTAIVEAVLAKDEQVAQATSSYIDDVLSGRRRCCICRESRGGSAGRWLGGQES